MESRAAANSTFAIGGVSCSAEGFVVNQTLVFQIKFCGKSPALLVAAKRQAVKKPILISKKPKIVLQDFLQGYFKRFKEGCFLGC